MTRKRNNEDFDDLGFDDQSPKRVVKNNKPNNDFISLDEDEQQYQTFKLPVIKQDTYQKVNKVSQKDKQYKINQNDYSNLEKKEKYDGKIGNNNQNDQSYDNYGNDFQDDAGDNQQYNAPNNSNNIKMYKYESQNQSLKGGIKNQSANQRVKQHSLNKNDSKRNIESQESHIGKFSSQVKNNFPQTDISKQSEDQIEKLNQKVRGMIRNLNNELNQILNRVTLDQRKPIQTKRNVEQVLKVMIETKKNNQKILDRGSNQLKKLNSKIGSIKGQNYQQQISTQVINLTAKKKQLQKTIVQMKAGYSINQKRPLLDKKNIELLKTELFNLKKDVDKHQTKQNELESKLESLLSKQNNVQRKHKDIVDKAHDKGIVLSTTKNIAKQKQLQEKQKALKKGIDSIEVLYKSKGDIINSENQRIKRQITNCQAQIKDYYNQIVELAGKSSLLIDKQKQNPKLMRNVLHSLEAFSRSISNPPIDYNVSSQRQLQSKSPIGTNRYLKNESRTQSDYSKSPSRPIKNTLNQNKNNLKPNFKKSHSNKVIEKQEQNKNIQITQNTHKIQKQIEKVQEVVNNNNKPTFNFRKRLESKSQIKDHNDTGIISPSPQLTQPLQKEQSEKVMKPFTRFRKSSSNNVAQTSNQPILQKPNNDNLKNNQVSEEPQQQQPRRFTLRRRGNNNQQSEFGYNPSVGSQQQDVSTPNSQRHIVKNEQQNNRYLPQQQLNKIQNVQPKLYDYNPPQQVLPSRKRNINKQSQDAQQNIVQQKAIQSIKQTTIKQRQGRLKKQKFNIEPQKSSNNIYSQAQDFTIKESSPVAFKKQQQLDLNQLIGNKKKLNQNDELQFDNKKNSTSNNTKNKNKQDDFFGFDL